MPNMPHELNPSISPVYGDALTAFEVLYKKSVLYLFSITFHSLAYEWDATKIKPQLARRNENRPCRSQT